MLRINLSANPDASTLIARARDTVLTALVHQDVPFERIVGDLGVARSLAYTPLFQAMFAWQTQNTPNLALPGVTIEALPVRLPTAKFDITLFLAPAIDGSIQGGIQYDASLFNPDTVARWSSHFLKVLEGLAVQNITTPVLSLDILDPAERTLLLETFNNTTPMFLPAPHWLRCSKHRQNVALIIWQ